MPLPRRVRPDALAAVVAAVQVFGSVGAARGQPDRDPIDAIAVVLLITGPASLVAYRRWPLVPVVVSVAATCTFIGLGYPFGPVFTSVAIAFFLAVQHAPRRLVLPLAAVSAVAFVTVAWNESERDDFGWVHALGVVGWLTVVLAVSEIVRGRREQMRERRHTEQVERDRRLADERVRLAQELHDVLGHNISLVNVQASVALHLIDEQPERVPAALANIKAASAEALDQLRAALDMLRGGEHPHAPAPRLGDLPELVAGVRAGGLTVDLAISGGEASTANVPSAVELAAYRIVQEALTNVTRHSNAERVEVAVAIADGSVDVTVVDDGRGADRDEVSGHADGDPGGRGLIGMRDRAAAFGGTVDAGPVASGGFRVAAHLPWRSP